MRQRDLHVRAWLGALALGGGTFLVSEEASAQAVQQPGEHIFTGGISISVSLGARTAFGIGPDFRYTYFTKESAADPIGFGVFIQPTYLKGGAFRIAGGLQGATLLEGTLMLNGELGLSYRTMSMVDEVPGGLGLHLGILPLFAFGLIPIETGPTFRGVLGLSKTAKHELILGGDIRGPGACFVAYGCSWIVEGRALRTAADAPPIHAPLGVKPSRRPSRLAQRIPSEARQALFAHHARDMSAECASIPAFLALARDLKRAGAPSMLLEDAHRAAVEEVTHTELCGKLAGGFGEVDLEAFVPAIPRRQDVDEVALLTRLATESFWDGCIGEGAAAARARRGHAAAKLDEVAQVLATVAYDEQNHADLAERVIAFCLDKGGAPVRRALWEQIEMRRDAEEAKLNTSDMAGDASLEAFGVPGGDLIRAAQEEAFTKSVNALRRI